MYASKKQAGLTSIRTRRGFLGGLAALPLLGQQTRGVRVFRGIPFAEPPVGKLRYLPPVPITDWDRARDTSQFAAAAVQNGLTQVRQSEDCLYLNVWVPEGNGPFPVFVWIHGGGFTGGYAFDPTFDGSKFARDGIVCITVAYRLGVLGFLDVPNSPGSANNGVRDLIAALRWVRNNIAQVGGDPEKVTVGGESAGAKLTGLLMGVPGAQPLFHQMISESGGAERIWPKAEALAVSRGFGTPPEQLADLMARQQEFLRTWPQHFPLRAEIDGTLFPRPPVEAVAKGSTRGKRLLIGTNRDESASFIGPHPAADATAGDLGNMSIERFRKVYAGYAAVYPDLSLEQRRIRAVTAEEYWLPSVRLADAHVRGGGEAWMYRMDFEQAEGSLKGYARHGIDVAKVWSNSDPVHRAWTAFIQGKVPQASGLPTWSAYRPDTRATMILDTVSRMELKPHEAELRLWDKV